ncbi:MAG: glycosyltransferase [Leptospiraceae bacterium]|nr:glycosyltransferase [Leptospiraceae bacterium]MCK6382165.1 glycosyltransferase [Leptospiraceae bacterium]NUM40987.1 glycosyltransferase [Leptospiraceae bacterium]
MIAAAGKGTRAYPKTTFIPKPLFQVERKTILHHNIDLLTKKLKVEKIYIIVGHLQEQVISEVDRIRLQGVKVSLETVPWTTKGLASDVASLEEKIQEPFFLILGDEFYYKTNHEVLLRTIQKYPGLYGTIGVLKTSVLSRIRKNYSVELEGDRIRNLVEKPVDPPNELLGLGTYFFSPEYFHFFKKTPPSYKSGVVEITDVIDRMAKETGKIYATTINCNYFNINSMQDFHYAVYEIRNDLFENYKISLVVPTENDEKSISDVLFDFKGKVHEIVVVDADSKDGTIEIAKKDKVRIEHYFYGKKKDYQGIQVRQGLDRATGDILVLTSSDGAFRSKDYPKLLEYMKDCDMVIGTRTTRQMIEQGSNLKPLVRLVNLFMGKMVEIFWWDQEPRFTDIDCKYMAIWKDSYNKIRPSLEVEGRLFTVEMMIEIIRAHMRCIEIPISYFRPVEKENYGFFNALSDAYSAFKIILRKKYQDLKI